MPIIGWYIIIIYNRTDTQIVIIFVQLHVSTPNRNRILHISQVYYTKESGKRYINIAKHNRTNSEVLL